VGVVVLLILALSAITVLAAASGPADRDISVSAAGGDNAPGGNSNIVRTTSTSFGTCTPFIGAAFSRDVSAPTSVLPVGTATLTLTVAALGGGNTYPLTLSLYSTTADISESPVTSTALDSLRGSSLNSTVTLNAAPAVGDTIVFPTSTEFVSAVNTAISGDGRLTVLVQITGCPNPSADTIDFVSHEAGTGVANFRFLDTNAVTLTNFRSADPTLNWPLIAGLGALVLFIAAGVVIYRRRATVRA